MSISKICKTCNLEKMEIALANKQRKLNKRQELFSPAHNLENYILKHNLYLLFLFCFYRILYNFLLIKIVFVLKNPSLHLVSKQLKKKAIFTL